MCLVCSKSSIDSFPVYAALCLAGIDQELVLQQALSLTSPLDIAEARTRLTQDELSITELFRENTPSVVFITNLASRSVHHQQDMYNIIHIAP